MNLTEANSLLLSGVSPSRILHFPAGIDLSLFHRSIESLPTRKYDIVIALKYTHNPHGHYYERKNYRKLLPLIKSLATSGLKIAIVGKDWSSSCLYQTKNVFIFDLPHSAISDVYYKSKLYVSLALQEGGPISFLEAAACGCLCLSSPTGFALDFGHSEMLGYYLLPSNASIEYISQMIHQIIVRSSIETHRDLILKRRISLEPYSFSSQALTLERLATL
jgi:glycosyltransferase involved in cell wall biosynthesis